MLRRMNDMEGYSISALDGFIGEVKDYYFDDASWEIRYLVVETGNWLESRKVLISPAEINGPNWSEKSIPAAITMEQVKNSPQFDGDPHLRSGNSVVRYRLQAADGDIGHVQAILIDEKNWAIRYFIVNTSNWWLGHEVLISPQWIVEINWSTSTILLPFERQSIRDAPPYDPNVALDRSHEARVYAHHRREGYWSGEAKDQAAIPHLG